MSRVPHSALVLTSQVEERRKRATWKQASDPDGLGVVRTLRFDKPTSRWLAPLLEEINDPRIAGTELTDAGYLYVTFVPGPLADHRDPFPLDDAATILGR